MKSTSSASGCAVTVEVAPNTNNLPLTLQNGQTFIAFDLTKAYGYFPVVFSTGTTTTYGVDYAVQCAWADTVYMDDVILIEMSQVKEGYGLGFRCMRVSDELYRFISFFVAKQIVIFCYN
jgi:hypothetical protein